MDQLHHSEHKLQELKFSSSRIESLTDGIFAFAMTLLVLNLNAPQLHGLITNQDLIQNLTALAPRFYIFLLSFALLASAWGVHHRQFSYIRGSDNTLMWINMLRLLFVVIVPFSSVLVGEYGDLPAAAFFFCFNMFGLSVVSYYELEYAVHKGFTEGLPDEHKRASKLKNSVPILVSSAACICALFKPVLSYWLFALIPIAIYTLKKAGRVV